MSKAIEYQEKYSRALALAELASGGHVTALGVLRLALLATSLGLLLVALGSVVAFLTKTQTGVAI